MLSGSSYVKPNEAECPVIIDEETGAKGIKGEKGRIGEKGQSGDKGEKGIIGKKGEQGNIGNSEKGSQGERGENGEKGRRGPQGISGKYGRKGRRGEKGNKGNSAEIKNIGYYSRSLRKSEQLNTKKYEKSFYLMPFVFPSDHPVLVADDVLIKEVDPSFFLLSSVSHRFDFHCERKEDFVLSSQCSIQTMFFSQTQNSDFPAIFLESLNISSIEQCGSLCYPHSIDSRAINSSSFSCDFIPSLRLFLPANMMLFFKSEFICSTQNEHNQNQQFVHLTDLLKSEELQIEENEQNVTRFNFLLEKKNRKLRTLIEKYDQDIELQNKHIEKENLVLERESSVIQQQRNALEKSQETIDKSKVLSQNLDKMIDENKEILKQKDEILKREDEIIKSLLEKLQNIEKAKK